MIRIGTSGWSYDHWQDVLYPAGLPARDRLAIYTDSFDTVELNSSFYRWPRTDSFRRWHERLPAGFRMAVKAPRGLTHAKRLYEPEVWIGRITQSLRALEPDPLLLVQLAPAHERDDARLDYFLSCLPRELRVAVEFRHPSWHSDDVLDLLERHGAAYCVMSGARLPCILRTTATFAYLRLHGPDDHNLYAGSYSDTDLAWWADRIREWDATGHDVFAYFNNDGDGNAVRNARTLRQILQV